MREPRSKVKSLSASLLVLATLSLGGVGCSTRVHMNDNFGRSYRQAFDRQTVNPGAGSTAKAPKGLDALEAGAVVDTYRKQLSPQGGGAPSDQGMILLSPQTSQLGYAAPPMAPAPK